MFFIAGIQPKTQRLDAQPQRCPACGLAQAYTTRVDHYLSLFFIPLIRVKKGEPFLLCEQCQRPVEESGAAARQAPSADGQTVCAACRKAFDGSYNYCPHCGQRAKAG